MQIIMMVWNGISGLGAGTIMLKGLFILVLAAIFWMLCELIKFMVKVFAGLAVDAFKYLAIMTRGWPKNEENDRTSGTLTHGNRIDKGIH